MDMKQRFIDLSWQILENKYRYYIIGNSIPDQEYDRLEDEYRQLAQELKLKPTAADMVGFDSKRPSCKLVMQKLGDK